ncbi:interleukin-8-like [Gouania willdenowi]|uniref:Interleukin-8-like n=1 Tax=Gouania willdenowi TaxID=441366 RepID=A0A8C5I6P0_GOUWI|nr:interleukin-8-like [Gouania willdenowi]
MFSLPTVALLVFIAIHDGACAGDQVGDRCRCINMERKPIGRYIAMVELQPANSQCAEVQIIATIKRSGMQICLDPYAPWVQKVLEKAKLSSSIEKGDPSLLG